VPAGIPAASLLPADMMKVCARQASLLVHGMSVLPLLLLVLCGAPAPPPPPIAQRTQIRVLQGDNFKLAGMDFLLMNETGLVVKKWANVVFNRMTPWLYGYPPTDTMTMLANSRKSPHGVEMNDSTTFPLNLGGPVYIVSVQALDHLSPCVATLNRFCGSTRTIQACNVCVGQHQGVLLPVGCQPADVRNFCEVGPQQLDLVVAAAACPPLANPDTTGNVAVANMAPSFPELQFHVGPGVFAIYESVHFRQSTPYKAVDLPTRGSSKTTVSAMWPNGTLLVETSFHLYAGQAYTIFLLQDKRGHPVW
jgi:hypothetical protein